MRALTCSVSTPMILRMLERHGFRLFRRFPVVFDDITRRRFTEHGLDTSRTRTCPR